MTTNVLTAARMAEIAGLALRLHQIGRCAAVTSTGETVLHHSQVEAIYRALTDLANEVERRQLPAGWQSVPTLLTDEMANAFDPLRKLSLSYLRNGWCMALSAAPCMEEDV